MKLGVVITGEEMAGPAADLLQAAADRNHELRCFLTDTGIRALDQSGIQELVGSDRLTLAVCEFSMERFEQTVPSAVADAVIVGGQYQDAELAHRCHRVVGS